MRYCSGNRGQGVEKSHEQVKQAVCLAGGFMGGCGYNLLLKKYAAMACLGLFLACFSASFQSGGRQWGDALPSV
jgi:hypothetical protein